MQQILFDKEGNEIQIHEVIRDFIKNNLEVNLTTSRESDWEQEYISVSISITLCNEEITSAKYGFSI